MSTSPAPITREALLKTLGPTGSGYSLPQEAYTSPEVFEWSAPTSSRARGPV